MSKWNVELLSGEEMKATIRSMTEGKRLTPDRERLTELAGRLLDRDSYLLAKNSDAEKKPSSITGARFSGEIEGQSVAIYEGKVNSINLIAAQGMIDTTTADELRAATHNPRASLHYPS